MTSPLMSVDEAARMVGLTGPCLRRLVHAGEGPTAIRVGRRKLKFEPTELDRWLTSRRVGGPSAVTSTPHIAHEQSAAAHA